MSEIETVLAREILDSRGNPTVEVDVALRSGALGRAAVPSGASTGEHEAHRAARRRQEALPRQGRHARRSTTSTTTLAPAVIGLDALDQAGLDRALLDARRHAEQAQARRQRHPRRLDGRRARGRRRERPCRSGATSAARRARVLPVPLMNIINGGAHADNGARHPGVHDRARRRADASPRRCAPAPRSSTRSRRCCNDKGLSTAVGDEGGFAPRLASNEEAARAHRSRRSRTAGYKPGKDVALALDCAASEFFDKGSEDLHARGQEASSSTPSWSPCYDEARPSSTRSSRSRTACAEDDWDGWKLLTDSARQARPARRRRPVRHQHRAPQARASTRASPTRS